MSVVVVVVVAVISFSSSVVRVAVSKDSLGDFAAEDSDRNVQVGCEFIFFLLFSA